MIQRIQSVYLFVVAVLCALMFAFPLWKGISTTSPGEVEKTLILDVFSLRMYSNGSHLEVLQSTWWLAIISGLVVVMALSAIFFYTNRVLQLRLGRLCILFLTAQIVLIFYHIFEAKDMIAEGHTEFYDVGIYLPVGAIVFLFFAGRGIMKDERMVRAADRLR